MWATSDPAQRLCQLGLPPCRDQTRASPISEVTQDLPHCSPPTCHYRGLNEPQASPRVSAPHLPDDRTAVHSHLGHKLSTCGLGAGEQFPGVSLHDWPANDFSPSEIPAGAPKYTQILDGCHDDTGVLQAWPGVRGLVGSVGLRNPVGDGASRGSSVTGPRSP